MPLRAVLNKSFIVESYSILHLKNEMHHLIRQSSVAHILSFVIAMIERIGVDIEWSMTSHYSSLGHPPDPTYMRRGPTYNAQCAYSNLC